MNKKIYVICTSEKSHDKFLFDISNCQNKIQTLHFDYNMCFLRLLTTSRNNHIPLSTIHGNSLVSVCLAFFKHGIITEGSDQKNPKEKEIQEGKRLSGEALQQLRKEEIGKGRKGKRPN